MMIISKFQHLVRKTTVESAINAMEAGKDTFMIYMEVLVCDMNDKHSKMMLDVPVEKVNENGLVTLNISLRALEYRIFNEIDLTIKVRFNGLQTDLTIPYSLVVSLSALRSDKSLLSFEHFLPFPPHIDASEAEKTAVKTECVNTGNVVSLFGPH